jgi:protein subunit release factor A
VFVSEAVIVEIRAGEGGKHAKLLVEDYVGFYVKYGSRRGL